jgi:recombination protein RecR
VNHLAAPLERVINELGKLPSIGRKTALRLAFHLLKVPRDEAAALAEAIRELQDKIRHCMQCYNFSEQETCEICNDPRRDRKVLCVVEEPTNLLAVERTGIYRGLYHVLGGALSPLKDVGPDQLHTRELIERARALEVTETVLATNADVEGEATAVYISRLLKPLGVRITRLAQGLPAGGDLEYTDDLTLRRALEGRRDY